MYNNFEISLLVFMPNITTNHAITSTNYTTYNDCFVQTIVVAKKLISSYSLKKVMVIVLNTMHTRMDANPRYTVAEFESNLLTTQPRLLHLA